MNVRAMFAVSSITIAACGGAETTASSSAASTDDLPGPLPAYYDDTLFMINLKQQPAQAEQSAIAHNASINTIYESNALVNGAPFTPVLDAIQGDGFNPLWQEVEITFNVAPFQLTRDDDVTAAADAGQITLTVTNEVYRCSVIGKK